MTVTNRMARSKLHRALTCVAGFQQNRSRNSGERFLNRSVAQKRVTHCLCVHCFCTPQGVPREQEVAACCISNIPRPRFPHHLNGQPSSPRTTLHFELWTSSQTLYCV